MKMLIAPLLSIAFLAGCSEEAGTADTAAAPPETAAPMAAEPGAAPMAGSDAQSTGMSEADHQAMGMDMDGAAGTMATATGTVESVDPSANQIVIAHGPVETLKWPAMTMGFTATPDQIQAVEAGQKVSFEFRSAGATNTITSITPAE